MKDISIFLAIFAGLSSFLSPCVLPMIPAYLTYLAGISIEDIKKNGKMTVFINALGFVAGFSTIFILMGLSITALGIFLTKNNFLLKKLGAIVIIIFGLQISGLINISFLNYEKRPAIAEKFSKSTTSFLLGLAFALGWTPCIGPILGSILLYAGSQTTILKGTLLLIFYSLGFSIPFLLAALIFDKLSIFIKKISKYFIFISMISGAVLILLGLKTLLEGYL